MRPMARGLPGDYVLYCQPDRPPWPAVVMTNDMLPRHMRKARQPECQSPVLLLQKLIVRWEFHPRLEEYGDYVCPDDLAKKYPGLRDAHNSMLEAIADGLGLRHWGSVIAAIHEVDDLHSPPHEPDEDDSDVNEAIRASLGEQIRTKRPAPNEADEDEEITMSPSKMLKTRLHAPENGLNVRNSKAVPLSRHHGGPDCRASNANQAAYTITAAASISGRDLACSDSNNPPVNEDASSYNESDVSLLHTFDSSASEGAQPTDSTEDDDELMGKDMTCWLIGPDLDKFYIPYSAITERDYLKRMGILQPHGRHGWTVTKPAFADIDPDHFRPVAEFLCTGDLKNPTHGPTGELLKKEELDSEAIVLYGEAWPVAESLSLHDMMEAIVSKMKALQSWPLVELLMFARRVYSIRSVQAFPVDADMEMKGIISSYIAKNYNEYVTKGGSTFLEELRSSRELRRDVHQAMADDAAKELDDDW